MGLPSVLLFISRHPGRELNNMIKAREYSMSPGCSLIILWEVQQQTYIFTRFRGHFIYHYASGSKRVANK